MHPAVRTCAIVAFGWTALSILTSPHFANTPRDLDVLEVFTVAESVVRAARAEGYHAEGYDYMNPHQSSVTGQAGFLQVVNLVMRVKEGGLICIAPDCKSFAFSCSSKTGRKATNFAGDRQSLFVQAGNRMAEIGLLLYIIALARGVHVCLENPSGSTIFSFLKEHIDKIVQAGWAPVYCLLDRCAFVDLRPTFKKKYKFMCSSTWFEQVVKKCNCNGGVHIELMERKQGKNGKMQVNGVGPRLRESGLYPRALGQAIVAAWIRWSKSGGATVQPLVPVMASPIPEDDDPWGDVGGSSNSCKISSKKRKAKDASFQQDADFDPWG